MSNSRLCLLPFLTITLLCCNSSESADRTVLTSEVTPWYERSVRLDFTGDGRPDSVSLVAEGTEPDSLQITLRFFANGAEVYREEWDGSYEMVDVADSLLVRPRQDAYIRTRLDRALSSVVVEPLDEESFRLMGGDSTVLQEVRPRPTRQVRFSYGYESTVVLSWDTSRRRLAFLYSCC
jgi:hypothetical protein